MQTVAVIGAGPAGLAVAKFLKSEGLAPVVFEQASSVGGQWSGAPECSGVWPSLCINTSRLMTVLSDLRHEPGAPLYPSNKTMHAYLERYAERFGLMACTRLKTRVLRIERDPDGSGWLVRFSQEGAAPRAERFDKVVVASGRYNKPAMPAVPGLESFSGAGGVSHAFNYKQPERYRGQRVLVVGCSISAVEIASDLVGMGAAHVISAYRRQRYFHQRIIGGMPADLLFINRYRVLAEETYPLAVSLRSFKDFVVRTSGSPEQFGARKPADCISAAGITMSQTYLPLVAEGRIETRPWLQAIDGQTVRFTDGSADKVDAIIFGTGYDLNLPFLDDELRSKLDVDATHIDLYKHTFHPDLPGLAFLGILELIGSNFPALELQARWIAYVFSGARPAPSMEEMQAGVATCKARRSWPQWVAMHHATLMFARELDVEPDLQQWPHLARELLFGPMSALSFRLCGHDSLPQAEQRLVEDARTSGLIQSPEFNAEESAQLQALAKARRDNAFAHFVAQVTAARPMDTSSSAIAIPFPSPGAGSN
jgi:dimethylaniline monooxygenase (N-oxide forming)